MLDRRPKHRSRWVVLLVAFAVGIAAPNPILGKDRTSSSGILVTEDVNVVNVPVYVRDRSGQWITGLTADDFVVREDGKKVTITNFCAVDRTAGGQVSRLGTLSHDGDPFGDDSYTRNRFLNLVVYLDITNLDPGSRSRTLEALRESFRAADNQGYQVMFVVQNPDLEIVQPFTSDISSIEAALDALDVLVIERTAGIFEPEAVIEEAKKRFLALERPDDHAAVFDATAGLLKSHVSTLVAQTTASLDNLKHVSGALGVVEGRKAILYVSNGIETAPGQDVALDVQAALRQFFTEPHFATEKMEVTEHMRVTGSPREGQSYRVSETVADEYEQLLFSNLYGDEYRSASSDLTHRFAEVANEAGANRIGIYLVNAESIASGVSPNGPSAPAHRQKIGSHDRLRDTRLSSTSSYLADATGGLSLDTKEELQDGLEGLLEDSVPHYSLGYAADHSGDGKPHRIKVKIKNVDAVVRYRTSYVDKPSETRQTDRVLSALLIGWDQNPHEIRLETGQHMRTNDGGYVQHIRVLVPVRSLSLKEQGDTHTTALSAVVALTGPEGRVKTLQDITAPVQVPAEKMELIDVLYYPIDFRLNVQAGTSQVAMGLWERDSRMASFASREFSIELD